MEETKRILSKIDSDKFRQYIEGRTGMYIDDSKLNSLKISINSRMVAVDIKDYSTYYSLITANATGKKEFDELLDIILIKETFFFRDERQLNVLTKNILPDLAARKNGKEIKIWSAGCATGEEPYSIAMAIMEGFLCDNINVSIYATDISAEALKKAKEAIYGKSSMRSIDRAMLDKYFTHRDGRYHLHDRVKLMVRFDTVNLVDTYFPAEGSNFDIVFCKNVIIYFRLDTVKTVIRRFYDVLAPGGCLFVGHSESLWQISADFDLEEISGVFLYRKDGRNKALAEINPFRQRGKTSAATAFPRTAIPSPHRTAASRHGMPPTQVVKGDVVTQHAGGIRKKDLSEWIKNGVLPSDGNSEAALEEIEEILQGDPKNIDVHLLAGKIYANMGLYDKALKKGMDVVEINDLSAGAYLLMGSIYYKIGEKEKAISAFKKTIYLDDNSVI
ncbi:MAG: CheR family methyltransferase, partial [Candidatus Brocadiales bacterium]|nr:CheR family methyltransferase [Candidatus Brocadiales bacterium]